MGRDVRVSFKLTEEKKEELEALADSYGVTMSGMCALIVGQWLHQQNKVVNPMIESIGQVIREQIEQVVSSEETMYEMIQRMKGPQNTQ